MSNLGIITSKKKELMGYDPLTKQKDIFGLPIVSSNALLENKTKKQVCEEIQELYDLPNWTCDRIPREEKYIKDYVKTFPKTPGQCIPSKMVSKAIKDNYILKGDCLPKLPGNKKTEIFCSKFNNNDCNKALYFNQATQQTDKKCVFKPDKNQKKPDVNKQLKDYCETLEQPDCDTMCEWQSNESDIEKCEKNIHDYIDLKNKLESSEKQTNKLKKILDLVHSNNIDSVRTTAIRFTKQYFSFFIIIKIITMAIAGYLSWKCGYKNQFIVRFTNTMGSMTFSMFYLIYYYFMGKYNNKIC